MSNAWSLCDLIIYSRKLCRDRRDFDRSLIRANIISRWLDLFDATSCNDPICLAASPRRRRAIFHDFLRQFPGHGNIWKRCSVSQERALCYRDGTVVVLADSSQPRDATFMYPTDRDVNVLQGETNCREIAWVAWIILVVTSVKNRACLFSDRAYWSKCDDLSFRFLQEEKITIWTNEWIVQILCGITQI